MLLGGVERNLIAITCSINMLNVTLNENAEVLTLKFTSARTLHENDTRIAPRNGKGTAHASYVWPLL